MNKLFRVPFRSLYNVHIFLFKTILLTYRCGFPWGGGAHLFGASVQQVEEVIPICLLLSGASVQQVVEMMQILYCNSGNSFLLPPFKGPELLSEPKLKNNREIDFLIKGPGGGGGLHQNSLEIDFIVVSDRRE